MTETRTLPTESLRAWLSNHKSAIEAGINVGQLARDKAQAFRLELARRGGGTR